MKPFNLDEYLKNPDRKVITRDGRKVRRILCTDARGEYPIVALVEHCDGTHECAYSFKKDGRFYDNGSADKDLFFVSEKHEGWINIFFKGASNDNRYVGYARIFKSKEDAEKEGEGYSNYITTLKIEWEE